MQRQLVEYWLYRGGAGGVTRVAFQHGRVSGVDARYDARSFLVAGRLVGGATLLRFYVLHCVFIPVIASVLMIVHFWRIRKDGGISGPL